MTETRLEIRQAGKDDVAQIVELNFGLFQEDAGQRDPFMNLNWPKKEGEDHFSNLVSGANSICLLVECDGEAVGYLVGYVRKKTSLRPVEIAELESMYVKKEFRRRGVGGRLAKEFLEWCKARGVQRVSVTAYAANEAAIAFYERLGFEPKRLSLEVGLK